MDQPVGLTAESEAAEAPTRCLDCGTTLAGGWCHCCGQRVEAHGRSVRHVAFEIVEILIHADSRLWRTLRDVTLHPARLTRDDEGRRARQISPLRLFFVMRLFFGIG